MLTTVSQESGFKCVLPAVAASSLSVWRIGPMQTAVFFRTIAVTAAVVRRNTDGERLRESSPKQKGCLTAKQSGKNLCTVFVHT